MNAADRLTMDRLRHEAPEPMARLGRIVNEARLLQLESEDLRDVRLRIAAGFIEGAARLQWERLRRGA